MNTVCWNCGDQASTIYEGQPLCAECFNYLMLEMSSAYADFGEEHENPADRSEVQPPQKEDAADTQQIPF